MKAARIPLLLLSAILLLVVSTSERIYAESEAAFKVVRKPGTVWTFEEKYLEKASAKETEKKKTTTYAWEFAGTRRNTIYFKSKEKGRWNTILAQLDTDRDLKSYKIDGKDVTASQKTYQEPIGASQIKTAEEKPSGEDWEQAVIDYIRLIETEHMSNEKWEGTVKIGGVECGEYSFEVKDIEVGVGEKKLTTWRLEGGLSAVDEKGGSEVEIRNYKAAWGDNSCVPDTEEFELKIERRETADKKTTVSIIEREIKRETTGLKLLDEKETAKIDAQIKKWKEGRTLLTGSNMTPKVLFSGQWGGKKGIEAGETFYSALQEDPDGPLSEYVALWFWNINYLTQGSVLRVEIGKPVPSLLIAKWYNTKGYSDEDLKGKVVAVDMFQTWCGPCIGSIPHLRGLYDKYKAKGLVVIGLSTLKPTKPGAMSIPEVIRTHNATYPIACDEEFYLFDQDGKVIRPPQIGPVLAYKTHSFLPGRIIPRAYVIDRKGILRWTGDPMDPEFQKTIEKLLGD
ncbi:MAG: TlpA disulfide reductase family protein [Planctomycetota bacterium]